MRILQWGWKLSKVNQQIHHQGKEELISHLLVVLGSLFCKGKRKNVKKKKKINKMALLFRGLESNLGDKLYVYEMIRAK